MQHIWYNRDLERPELCFDKHDGRAGEAIFTPPSRGTCGVVIPCRIFGGPGTDPHGEKTVHIINNNITVTSPALTQGEVENINVLKRPMISQRQAPVSGQKTQSHFRRSEIVGPKEGVEKGLERNRGRFIRKSVVPAALKRPVAPAIPMNVRGLKRVLKHFVVGDKDRGLSIPLLKLTTGQRNGVDPSGKANKHLYSKRRRVPVAVLLALREAADNNISFCNALGAPGAASGALKMCHWEQIAKEYLGRRTKRLNDSEIHELALQVYKPRYLDLLPDEDL